MARIMSKKRKYMDKYYTPEPFVAVMLDRISAMVKPGSVIYEPCSGDLSLVHVLREAGYKVITNDLDEKCSADTHFNVYTKSAWNFVECDLVMTNPPFEKNGAQRFARYALAYCPNVIMLARISFMEPTNTRQEFLAAYPPRQQIVLPRYSFTGDGSTDSVTVAWYVWGNKRNGEPIDCDIAVEPLWNDPQHPLYKELNK